MHSSIEGHLGCFHVLAVVNSAAVTIRVYVSFRIIFLSSYMPRSGTAGSYSISDFCFFGGTSILFSTEATPAYIHSNSVGGNTPFLHSLSSICYLETF